MQASCCQLDSDASAGSLSPMQEITEVSPRHTSPLRKACLLPAPPLSFRFRHCPSFSYASHHHTGKRDASACPLAENIRKTLKLTFSLYDAQMVTRDTIVGVGKGHGRGVSLHRAILENVKGGENVQAAISELPTTPVQSSVTNDKEHSALSQTHERSFVMDAVVNPASAPATMFIDQKDHGYGYDLLVASKDADLHDADRAASIRSDIGNAIQFLRVDIERNGRSAELATEKTSAALALAAAVNTAAVQAAIAACCCEQKELARAEGEATRALINSLHTQSVALELSDAKVQLSNASQTAALIEALGKKV